MQTKKLVQLCKKLSYYFDGYNGTPHGFENECEDLDGNTKWYTLHSKAITKLDRTGNKQKVLHCIYT